MTHELNSLPSGKHLRTSAAQGSVRVGPLTIPIGVVAWGISGAVHAGVFTGMYALRWTPSDVSIPRIELARGEHAVQVAIHSSPWPAPVEELGPKTAFEDDPRSACVPEAPAATLKRRSDYVDVPAPSGVSEQADFAQAVRFTEAEPPEAEMTLAENSALAARSSRQELEGPADAPKSDPVDAGSAPMPTPLKARQSTIPARAPAFEEMEAEFPESAHVANELRAVKPGVDTGVEVLRLPRPTYPSVSRRLGEEGVVLLSVEVLANGSAGAITVLRDPGFPRLTAAAVAAAREARFRPAVRNGRPVAAAVRIPFRFVIE